MLDHYWPRLPSPQTCCACSSTPCTTRTLSKRRPSTNGSPAKTLQSKQAKVWPWNQSPPSSPGSARPRRSLTRSEKKMKKKTELKAAAPLWQGGGSAGSCRESWTILPERQTQNQSSMRINLYYFSLFFEGWTQKTIISLYPPSLASSLFPHLLVTASVLIKINLKTDSAGLLVNEVWSIPHHYKTFFLTIIQTNRLLFYGSR